MKYLKKMEKEIKKMEENKQEQNPEQKPRFKAWMRSVALLVVVVFVPEQAAWAMGYDPSVLWAPKYYLGTGQAGYMANFVAENTRRSLNFLANKPLQQVEIAPNLVVDTQPLSLPDTTPEASDKSSSSWSLPYYNELSFIVKRGVEAGLSKTINLLESARSFGKSAEEIAHHPVPSAALTGFLKQGLQFVDNLPGSAPLTNKGYLSPGQEKASLYITSSQIKKIYAWIRDPATQIDNYCGVYALHNLLKDNKIDITLEDLAYRVILVDLLSGNIKEFKEPLKTSLYALDKVANSLGLNTLSVKFKSAPGINDSLTPLIPFVAHLKYGHFVFVTKIDAEKVYFYDKSTDKEISFLPHKKFLEQFSGYCLIKKSTNSAALVEIATQEAASIKGSNRFTDWFTTTKPGSGAHFFQKTIYHDRMYDPMYTKGFLPAGRFTKDHAQGIGGAAAMVGGTVLMFVPGGQGLGIFLIGGGANSIWMETQKSCPGSGFSYNSVGRYFGYNHPNSPTLWESVLKPVQGGLTAYGAASIANIGVNVGRVAIGGAEIGGLTQSAIRAALPELARRVAFNMALNETFLQLPTLAATNRFNTDWRANAIALGSGAFAGMAPGIAKLGSIPGIGIGNVAPAFITTVASQAALFGKVYLLTGIASDVLIQSKAPTFRSMWGHYKGGLQAGALFGTLFGGAAWGAKLLSESNLVANSQRLSQIALLASKHQLITRLGAYTVGGALSFPLVASVLEGESSQLSFPQRLKNNYSNPWNYARGGIIGFGTAWGTTPLAKTDELQGLQTLLGRGVLSAPTGELSGMQSVMLGVKRFAYGGFVGMAALPGVNALKGDYNPAKANNQNWARRLAVDIPGSFVLGGLTSTYISGQGKNILSALQQLGNSGEAQPVKIFGMDLMDLGTYKGPMLLYNQALSGAVEWLAVSPAFTLGGGLWESIKLKSGYYNNQLSPDLYTQQAKANLVLWKPWTWVQKRGYVAQGDNTYKVGFSTLTSKDYLQSAIMGPRSGAWMKPMINLFQSNQTIKEQASWYNRQPGLVGRGIDLARWTQFKLTGGSFNQWALEQMATNTPNLLGSALGWADSTVLFMPMVVTGIDSAINTAEDQILVFTNKKPKFETINGDTYIRHGYIPAGVQSFAKWLPFLMIPQFQPTQEDLQAIRERLFSRAGGGGLPSGQNGIAGNGPVLPGFEGPRQLVLPGFENVEVKPASAEPVQLRFKGPGFDSPGFENVEVKPPTGLVTPTHSTSQLTLPGFEREPVSPLQLRLPEKSASPTTLYIPGVNVDYNGKIIESPSPYSLVKTDTYGNIRAKPTQPSLIAPNGEVLLGPKPAKSELVITDTYGNIRAKPTQPLILPTRIIGYPAALSTTSFSNFTPSSSPTLPSWVNNYTQNSNGLYLSETEKTRGASRQFVPPTLLSDVEHTALNLALQRADNLLLAEAKQLPLRFEQSRQLPLFKLNEISGESAQQYQARLLSQYQPMVPQRAGRELTLQRVTSKPVLEPVQPQQLALPGFEGPRQLALPEFENLAVKTTSPQKIRIAAPILENTIKESELALGNASNNIAFKMWPEQRQVVLSILEDATEDMGKMYTLVTRGGKTMVVIPIVEDAVARLDGRVIRVTPTDTGLETLSSDETMTRFAPNRLIITEEVMRNGLRSDPEGFIKQIEQANQIATSQTALGFTANFASLGDTNSERAYRALMKNDPESINIMIHDEAQYETPPTIVGEEMLPVKERYPEVNDTVKRVAPVIFSELELNKDNFIQEISDYTDTRHSARDYDMRRFNPDTLDIIAQRLHNSPETDRYSLSQQELRAINAIAEELATYRGTDHDYVEGIGIIEMHGGNPMPNTHPSDPYTAVARQQLYEYKYGIPVPDELIVTSPRGNQVGYGRVLNEFRDAGWVVPALTATPEARRAAWEYNIAMDVQEAVNKSADAFLKLDIKNIAQVKTDINEAISPSLFQEGRHIRIVTDAGVVDYNLLIDLALDRGREAGINDAYVQQPGGTWLNYRDGAIEKGIDGSVLKFSEPEVGQILMRADTPRSLIIHCPEGRNNTNVARYGEGTENIPEIAIIHSRSTSYDVNQILGRGNPEAERTLLVIDPTHSLSADNIEPTILANTEKKLAQDAVVEVTRLVNETVVRNLEDFEKQANFDKVRENADYFKEKKYDWQIAQRGEATPDIGTLQDVDNYLLDTFNRGRLFIEETLNNLPSKNNSLNMLSLIDSSRIEKPFENIIYCQEVGSELRDNLRGLGGSRNLSELHENFGYYVRRADFGEGWVYPGFNMDAVESRYGSSMQDTQGQILPRTTGQLVDRYLPEISVKEKGDILTGIQNPSNGFVWPSNPQILTPAGRQSGPTIEKIKHLSPHQQAALGTMVQMPASVIPQVKINQPAGTIYPVNEGLPVANVTKLSAQTAFDVARQLYESGLSLKVALPVALEAGHLNLGLQGQNGFSLLTLQQLANQSNIGPIQPLINAVQRFNTAKASYDARVKQAKTEERNELVSMFKKSMAIEYQDVAEILSHKITTPAAVLLESIKNVKKEAPQLYKDLKQAYQPIIKAADRLQQAQEKLRETQISGSSLSKGLANAAFNTRWYWLPITITLNRLKLGAGAQYIRAFADFDKNTSATPLSRISKLAQNNPESPYRLSAPLALDLTPSQLPQFSQVSQLIMNWGLDKHTTIQEVAAAVKSSDLLAPAELIIKKAGMPADPLDRWLERITVKGYTPFIGKPVSPKLFKQAMETSRRVEALKADFDELLKTATPENIETIKSTALAKLTMPELAPLILQDALSIRLNEAINAGINRMPNNGIRSASEIALKKADLGLSGRNPLPIVPPLHPAAMEEGQIVHELANKLVPPERRAQLLAWLNKRLFKDEKVVINLDARVKQKIFPVILDAFDARSKSNQAVLKEIEPQLKGIKNLINNVFSNQQFSKAKIDEFRNGLANLRQPQHINKAPAPRVLGAGEAGELKAQAPIKISKQDQKVMFEILSSHKSPLQLDNSLFRQLLEDAIFKRQWEEFGRSTTMTSGVKVVRVNREQMDKINAEFVKIAALGGLAVVGRHAKRILEHVNHPEANNIEDLQRVILLAEDIPLDRLAEIERHERRHHGVDVVMSPELRQLGEGIIRAIRNNRSLNPNIHDFMNWKLQNHYNANQLLDEVLAEGLLRVKEIRNRAKELGVVAESIKPQDNFLNDPAAEILVIERQAPVPVFVKQIAPLNGEALRHRISFNGFSLDIINMPLRVLNPVANQIILDGVRQMEVKLASSLNGESSLVWRDEKDSSKIYLHPIVRESPYIFALALESVGLLKSNGQAEKLQINTNEDLLAQVANLEINGRTLSKDSKGYRIIKQHLAVDNGQVNVRRLTMTPNTSEQDIRNVSAVGQTLAGRIKNALTNGDLQNIEGILGIEGIAQNRYNRISSLVAFDNGNLPSSSKTFTPTLPPTQTTQPPTTPADIAQGGTSQKVVPLPVSTAKAELNAEAESKVNPEPVKLPKSEPFGNQVSQARQVATHLVNLAKTIPQAVGQGLGKIIPQATPLASSRDNLLPINTKRLPDFQGFVFPLGTTFGSLINWLNNENYDQGNYHTGIDIFKYRARDGSVQSIPNGTPIIALSSGKVIVGNGNMPDAVVIQTEDRKLIGYWHIIPKVEVGSIIKAGDEIGTFGKPIVPPPGGKPHIHLEITKIPESIKGNINLPSRNNYKNESYFHEAVMKELSKIGQEYSIDPFSVLTYLKSISEIETETSANPVTVSAAAKPLASSVVQPAPQPVTLRLLNLFQAVPQALRQGLAEVQRAIKIALLLPFIPIIGVPPITPKGGKTEKPFPIIPTKLGKDRAPQGFLSTLLRLIAGRIPNLGKKTERIPPTTNSVLYPINRETPNIPSSGPQVPQIPIPLPIPMAKNSNHGIMEYVQRFLGAVKSSIKFAYNNAIPLANAEDSLGPAQKELSTRNDGSSKATGAGGVWIAAGARSALRRAEQYIRANIFRSVCSILSSGSVRTARGEEAVPVFGAPELGETDIGTRGSRSLTPGSKAKADSVGRRNTSSRDAVKVSVTTGVATGNNKGKVLPGSGILPGGIRGARGLFGGSVIRYLKIRPLEKQIRNLLANAGASVKAKVVSVVKTASAQASRIGQKRVVLSSGPSVKGNKDSKTTRSLPKPIQPLQSKGQQNNRSPLAGAGKKIRTSVDRVVYRIRQQEILRIAIKSISNYLARAPPKANAEQSVSAPSSLKSLTNFLNRINYKVVGGRDSEDPLYLRGNWPLCFALVYFLTSLLLVNFDPGLLNTSLYLPWLVVSAGLVGVAGAVLIRSLGLFTNSLTKPKSLLSVAGVVVLANVVPRGWLDLGLHQGLTPNQFLGQLIIIGGVICIILIMRKSNSIISWFSNLKTQLSPVVVRMGQAEPASSSSLGKKKDMSILVTAWSPAGRSWKKTILPMFVNLSSKLRKTVSPFTSLMGHLKQLPATIYRTIRRPQVSRFLVVSLAVAVVVVLAAVAHPSVVSAAVGNAVSVAHHTGLPVWAWFGIAIGAVAAVGIS